MSDNINPNDAMFAYNEEVVLIDSKFSGYDHIAHKNKKVTASGNVFSKEKMALIAVGDFDSLSQFLTSVGITPNEITELKDSIRKDGDVKKKLGPKVQGWLSKIAQESINGISKGGVRVGLDILKLALMKHYGLDK